MAFLRRHSLTVVIAMATAALTVGSPAVAGTIVDFARNAGKVDGIHAVKASTKQAGRKGKLVATSAKTGKLPDGIISKTFRKNFGPGRSDIPNSTCDPLATTDYLDCATVTLKMPRDSRVLLVTDASWYTQTSPGSGRCRFFGAGTSNHQTDFFSADGPNETHAIGLNEVTSLLPAGTYQFGLQCREFSGNTFLLSDVQMSAVAVGGL